MYSFTVELDQYRARLARMPLHELRAEVLRSGRLLTDMERSGDIDPQDYILDEAARAELRDRL